MPRRSWSAELVESRPSPTYRKAKKQIEALRYEAKQLGSDLDPRQKAALREYQSVLYQALAVLEHAKNVGAV